METTVSSYHYEDRARPNRLSRATIGGRDHKIHHDTEGNVTRYECRARTGCGDDTHIAWNGRNLPARITLGAAEAKNPKARDEFAYGPDGARYRRKTTFPDGASPRVEHTYYAGAFEELLPAPGSEHASIEQTRVTDAVRHVRTTAVKTTNGKKTTVVSSYVDYLHKDHLGSVEGATTADGARTRELAYDPYGGRRKADWTAALPESEISALETSSDPRTRGHTGHEHLDLTGFIHRGGRVYDPTLGRFLSPDPLVGNPGSAQSWNGYSYVSNSPMSFADPSGLSQRPAGCGFGGVMCRGRGGGASSGGFGLASVVSTHRFQWVDIFFSVASSWFDPGWGSSIHPEGIIHNVWGGGGVGDGGRGSHDSPAPFYFGFSIFSVSFNVTSLMGVGGVPRIADKPIDRNAKPSANRRHRPLTENEIELAKSVFKDAIDYSKVTIYKRKHNVFRRRKTPMAPDGNIYYPQNNPYYEDDLGGPNADYNDKAIFIHEMTHVWQHQQGIPVRRRVLLNPGDRVRKYELGQSFDKYGIEQQAEIVQEYYRRRESNMGSDKLKPYEDILPF